MVVVPVIVVDDDDNLCMDTVAFRLPDPSPNPEGLWCPNTASPKGAQPVATLGIV